MERAIDYIFSQLNRQDRGLDFLTTQINKRLKAQDVFNKKLTKYVDRKFALCGMGFMTVVVLGAIFNKRLEALEEKVEESK